MAYTTYGEWWNWGMVKYYCFAHINPARSQKYASCQPYDFLEPKLAKLRGGIYQKHSPKHAGTANSMSLYHTGIFWKTMETRIEYETYPLVNCHKTMENHHAIRGQIHYFNGHFQ